MNESEIATLQSLISSYDLQNETISSTKFLIDETISVAFESFLDKLRRTVEGNELKFVLEVNDESIGESFREENSQKLHRKVTVADYLTDLLRNLRGGLVDKVVNVIDCRLVADEKAFLNVRNKCVEKVYNSRDSSLMYREILERTMSYRFAEAVRFLKAEHKETLVKENMSLGDQLRCLQSRYNTLSTLHDEAESLLAQQDSAMIVMRANIQTSSETIYALRENWSIAHAKNEEYVERLILKVKKTMNNRRNQCTFEELPDDFFADFDPDDMDSADEKSTVDNDDDLHSCYASQQSSKTPKKRIVADQRKKSRKPSRSFPKPVVLLRESSSTAGKIGLPGNVLPVMKSTLPGNSPNGAQVNENILALEEVSVSDSRGDGNERSPNCSVTVSPLMNREKGNLVDVKANERTGGGGQSTNDLNKITIGIGDKTISKSSGRLIFRTISTDSTTSEISDTSLSGNQVQGPDAPVTPHSISDVCNGPKKSSRKISSSARKISASLRRMTSGEESDVVRLEKAIEDIMDRFEVDHVRKSAVINALRKRKTSVRISSDQRILDPCFGIEMTTQTEETNTDVLLRTYLDAAKQAVRLSYGMKCRYGGHLTTSHVSLIIVIC